MADIAGETQEVAKPLEVSIDLPFDEYNPGNATTNQPLAQNDDASGSGSPFRQDRQNDLLPQHIGAPQNTVPTDEPGTAGRTTRADQQNGIFGGSKDTTGDSRTFLKPNQLAQLSAEERKAYIRSIPNIPSKIARDPQSAALPMAVRARLYKAANFSEAQFHAAMQKKYPYYDLLRGDVQDWLDKWKNNRAVDYVALFEKAPLTSVKKTEQLLRSVSRDGSTPAYLQGLVDFMLDQRNKAREGNFTDRDIAKAYFMAVSSQRASTRSPRIINANELDLPTSYIDPNTGEVIEFVTQAGCFRPEEAAASWLFTEMGQRALNAIERGEFDEAAWQQGAQVRKAFGNDQLGLMGMFNDPSEGQVNMRNISRVTEAINAAKGDPQKIYAALKMLNGIGNAKTPFMGYLLGFGHRPTLDSVELNYWITGNADQAKGNFAKVAKAKIAANKLAQDKVYNVLFDRIQENFATLAKNGIASDVPDEIKAHVIHQLLWDAVRGSKTTHEGMHAAMRLATPLIGAGLVARGLFGTNSPGQSDDRTRKNTNPSLRFLSAAFPSSVPDFRWRSTETGRDRKRTDDFRALFPIPPFPGSSTPSHNTSLFRPVSL